MNRPQPVADDRDRDAISYLVSRLTGWDRPGIRAALARSPRQDLGDLLVAATVAGVTRPDQATPAVIAVDGSHWDRAAIALDSPRPSAADRLPSSVRVPIPVCDVCSQPWAGHVTQDHPYRNAAEGFAEAAPDAARRARARWTTDQTGA